MNLQILICTANERIKNIDGILLEPHKNIKYLISHQIYDGKNYDYNVNREDVEYYKLDSKGLSKNRNNAIDKASGDICLIADDDVKYNLKGLEKIIELFENNPDVDIFTFQVKSINSNEEFKNYPKNPLIHNVYSLLRVSSIEIVFRLEKIKPLRLHFNENFGLGTQFIGGEENIFLVDALKNKLKIKFEPEYIVSHPYERSGTIDEFSIVSTKTYGAKNYIIFGYFGFLLNLIISIKTYKKYKAYLSFKKFLKTIFQGSFSIKSQLKIKRFPVKTFINYLFHLHSFE